MPSFSHQIAARTLFAEARGEPLIGQIAVAWVMTNRVHDERKRWGGMYATVCTWPRQFSCWNEGDPNRVKMLALPDDDPVLLNLLQIVENAASNQSDDPTNGAKFYYAASIPEPSWAKTMIFCGQFGSQKFFKEPDLVA